MTQDLQIALSIDGEDHTWRMGDFTAIDARDYRFAVGSRLVEAFISPDLDAVAGLLWLAKRRTDPTVSYDDVAGGLSYDAVDFAAPRKQAAKSATARRRSTKAAAADPETPGQSS